MKHVCYKSAIPVVKAANNWLDYVKSLILQLDQNFSDKFFLLEYPIKESFTLIPQHYYKLNFLST